MEGSTMLVSLQLTGALVTEVLTIGLVLGGACVALVMLDEIRNTLTRLIAYMDDKGDRDVR